MHLVLVECMYVMTGEVHVMRHIQGSMVLDHALHSQFDYGSAL